MLNHKFGEIKLRYIKIFIIGFLSILIIQFGVLVFLEKVYFFDNATYASTKVDNNAAIALQWSKLTLEGNRTSTSISYDGKYLAYLKDTSLYVLNSENSKKNMVSAGKGMEITYFKWIYDRNRLIIAEKPINSKDGAYYKLYYYEIDKASKTEIFNEVDNKSIKIPIHDSKEKVSSIEMSTLTNAIYVKLTDPNNLSSIYRINIMAQESRIKTVTNHIGKIASTKRDDVLIYENLDNKKVISSSDNLPVEIDGQSSLSLLGTDNNDNTYLALTNNAKTNLIYYGNMTSHQWEKIYIKTAADPKNIYVNLKGQIFINDDSKSIIKEISTGKEIHYSGNLIDLYQDGMISEQDHQIINTIF
jgi:hypothetical protein